ncbi:Non-specific lipid-transfer protein 2 [Capsicum chinense]|nr:Non-specific lipid-transfer protein 2 [Capsicum chinense]
MEMVGKIACVVLLCMAVVAPHAEAITCGQVQSRVAPCLPYLTDRGPLGPCCGGVKGLLGEAKTPAERKTVCGCLKSAASIVRGINLGKAAGLPNICGVNIPYQISPSTDCTKYVNSSSSARFIFWSSKVDISS